MKRVAGVIVALLLAGVAAWLLHGAASPLDASHTHPQAGQQSYLWPSLEPGGDGDITYYTCASYVPSNWVVGIEDKWDAQLHGWQFDVDATCDAQTVLRWEGDGYSCPAGASACWQKGAYDCTAGEDHCDLVRARILFDRPKFDPMSYAWKTALTAHEWGHNMDLADHSEDTQAIAGTLMNHSIEDPPTFQGPTPADLQSVLCAAYVGCDLWGVRKSGGSKTEVHIQSYDTGAWAFIHQKATALATTGSNWQFGVGDWNGDGRPDLWGIKKSGTGSGKTEVHIQAYNASTNTWEFIHQKATALGETGSNWEFAVGDWNGDGRPDLWGIKKSSTGSGKTEVHIQSYNTAANTWQFIHQKATALGETGSNWQFAIGDWDWDVRPELWGIKKSGTGSGKTEIHIQSYNTATNTWQFIHQKATALGETGSTWQFAVAAWNRETLDLWGIKKSGTGSGNTELHIQSYDAGANEWDFTHQKATALNETGSNWEFAVAAWD